MYVNRGRVILHSFVGGSHGVVVVAGGGRGGGHGGLIDLCGPGSCITVTELRLLSIVGCFDLVSTSSIVTCTYVIRLDDNFNSFPREFATRGSVSGCRHATSVHSKGLFRLP